MSTKLTNLIVFALLAIAVIAGIFLYPQLPDPMPSHWNAAGQVDGYMSRFWGTFLVPIMTAGLLLLFLLIPRIDPLKANIEKFRPTFNIFVVIFTVYMLFIYKLTLLASFGLQFNMTYMIIPAVGLLFVVIGFMMRKAKRNFFIGIRTPWTLSNDQVWDETHKLGGIMFMIAGVLTAFTAFLGETGIYILLGVMLVAAFVPMIYSYFLYQKVIKQ